MPFRSFFFCAYCRHVDTSGGERVFGRSDRIPERSRGDESTEFQAGDEHLLRSTAHRQHVRGLWQVRCVWRVTGVRLDKRSVDPPKHVADVMLIYIRPSDVLIHLKVGFMFSVMRGQTEWLLKYIRHGHNTLRGWSRDSSPAAQSLQARGCAPAVLSEV